jgi:four helix bundle protein
MKIKPYLYIQNLNIMNKLKSYKDLLVWQRAVDISVEVYAISAAFPKEEVFGLTNQIRRASNSISLNIAEGYSRNSAKAYLNFLNIAQGSLFELESGIILAERLQFVKSESLIKLFNLITEESKMLRSLMNKIEEKTLTPKPKQYYHRRCHQRCPPFIVTYITHV